MSSYFQIGNFLGNHFFNGKFICIWVENIRSTHQKYRWDHKGSGSFFVRAYDELDLVSRPLCQQLFVDKSPLGGHKTLTVNQEASSDISWLIQLPLVAVSLIFFYFVFFFLPFFLEVSQPWFFFQWVCCSFSLRERERQKWLALFPFWSFSRTYSTLGCT